MVPETASELALSDPRDRTLGPVAPQNQKLAARRVPAVAVTPGNDLAWLWRFITRRLWLVVLVALLVTGLVFAILAVQVKTYTGTVELLVEPSQSGLKDLQEGYSGPAPQLDPADMETYLRMLQSDGLARDVIARLGMQPKPIEPGLFSPVINALAPLASRIEASIGQFWGGKAGGTAQGGDVAQLIPLPGAAASADDLAPRDRMLRDFHDNLAVTRDPLAHIVYVAYTAANPVEAARVANAVSEIFLSDLANTEQSISAKRIDYLKGRVQELSQDLDNAQRAVKDYENSNGLLQVSGSSAEQISYSQLIGELSQAQVDLDKANARYQRVGSGGVESIPEATNSPVIANLKEQEATDQRRLAQLQSTFGNRHPAVIQAKAQLADVRAGIAHELGTISTQLRSGVAIARQHVEDLQRQVDAAQARLTQTNQADARLKELQTRADTIRKSYESVSVIFDRAREQANLVSPSARIISAALPPTRPDSKKALLILGFTAVSSLGVGAALALALELGRRGYEDVQTLKAETGGSVVGLLPLLKKPPHTRRGGTTQPGDDELEAMAYTQSVQRAAFRLIPSRTRLDETCRVVVVTSALPGEGKTTFALDVARQFAFAGKRVALLDCDLRKRELENRLLTGSLDRPDHGLIDLLSATPPPLEEAIYRDPQSGLDAFLGLHSRIEPVRFLGSRAMPELLAALRVRYDVVVIDTPPILAVSDYALLVPFADEVAFVVRWRVTRKAAVRTAMRELVEHEIPQPGLVLNQIKLNVHQRRNSEDSLSYYKQISKYYRAA